MSGRPVTPGKCLEGHIIRSGYDGEKVASVLPCGYADFLNSGDPGNVVVSFSPVLAISVLYQKSDLEQIYL